MRILALTLVLFSLTLCTQKENSSTITLTDLELQILDSIHSLQGEFAVAFKNLDSANQVIFVNKSAVFHAASTMKTPVMIEVFKQIDAGNLNLEDSIPITNKFRSIVDSSWYELNITDDSEPHLYKLTGHSMEIGGLIELMITESSNLANNLLIDLVKADNISKSMMDMGAGGMKVLRGVEDLKAFEQGLNNTTDAYSLMVIYEQLARGAVISPQASEAMLEVLKRQKFKDIIPALLPSEVVVAHKTGNISGVHHDSGIVFLPDGRKYVLVLMSQDLNDFDRGTRLLQNISRMVYDYMMAINN